MIGKIIKEEDKPEFKKFKLELTVSSLEHARLLFHVFNNGWLSDVINNCDEWYSMEHYSKVTGNLTGNGVGANIKEYLKECGQEV